MQGVLILSVSIKIYITADQVAALMPKVEVNSTGSNTSLYFKELSVGHYDVLVEV